MKQNFERNSDLSNHIFVARYFIKKGDKKTLMQLKMFLADIFIDYAELDYTGLISCEQKQEYHEKLRDELFNKHKSKIKIVNRMPVFYVARVQSKMNDEGFETT